MSHYIPDSEDLAILMEEDWGEAKRYYKEMFKENLEEPKLSDFIDTVMKNAYLDGYSKGGQRATTIAFNLYIEVVQEHIADLIDAEKSDIIKSLLNRVIETLSRVNK